MMPGPTTAIPPVPRETKRTAKAVFGSRNFYVLTGERLEAILEELQLEFFSEAEAGKVLLPLITFFQFLEGLTDEQARDAVRTRIDWKFALHLPINTLLFHKNALCEFRNTIITSSAAQREFQKLVDQLMVLLHPHYEKCQGTQSLHLVLAVCSLNRLDVVHGALHEALKALAGNFPEWMRQTALPHWYGRYYHFSPRSSTAASAFPQELSIDEIGADIHHLLTAVDSSGSQAINQLKEVRVLRQIWEGQFEEENSHLKLSALSCSSCPVRSKEF